MEGAITEKERDRMTDNELLLAISNMMDQKLEDLKKDLQMQIKRTERSLKAEIVESENLILDEVSRVHRILNEHTEDKKKHIA